MADKIAVLIVDDHAVVRNGIAGFLNMQPDIEVVGEADSGVNALPLVEQTVPDVVLMDLIMPEMDGIAATAEIKRISPHTQVVILTSFHEDEHIFPAIKAGALSYILKDIGPKELADTVRAAATGEVTLHPKVAKRLMHEVRQESAGVTEPVDALTEREREVLLFIADGLSNADIAGRLVVSHQTVKGHVSNILSKLNLADRTQAAIFAWRVGLARTDPDNPES